MIYYSDFYKVTRVVDSCTTKQHVVVAFKMIDFLAVKFITVSYLHNPIELLRNRLHNKALQLKRNSQPFNIITRE